MSQIVPGSQVENHVQSASPGAAAVPAQIPPQPHPLQPPFGSAPPGQFAQQNYSHGMPRYGYPFYPPSQFPYGAPHQYPPPAGAPYPPPQPYLPPHGAPWPSTPQDYLLAAGNHAANSFGAVPPPSFPFPLPTSTGTATSTLPPVPSSQFFPPAVTSEPPGTPSTSSISTAPQDARNLLNSARNNPIYGRTPGADGVPVGASYADPPPLRIPPSGQHPALIRYRTNHSTSTPPLSRRRAPASSTPGSRRRPQGPSGSTTISTPTSVEVRRQRGMAQAGRPFSYTFSVNRFSTDTEWLQDLDGCADAIFRRLTAAQKEMNGWLNVACMLQQVRLLHPRQNTASLPAHTLRSIKPPQVLYPRPDDQASLMYDGIMVLVHVPNTLSTLTEKMTMTYILRVHPLMRQIVRESGFDLNNLKDTIHYPGYIENSNFPFHVGFRPTHQGRRTFLSVTPEEALVLSKTQRPHSYKQLSACGHKSERIICFYPTATAWNDGSVDRDMAHAIFPEFVGPGPEYRLLFPHPSGNASDDDRDTCMVDQSDSESGAGSSFPNVSSVAPGRRVTRLAHLVSSGEELIQGNNTSDPQEEPHEYGKARGSGHIQLLPSGPVLAQVADTPGLPTERAGVPVVPVLSAEGAIPESRIGDTPTSIIQLELDDDQMSAESVEVPLSRFIIHGSYEPPFPLQVSDVAQANPPILKQLPPVSSPEALPNSRAIFHLAALKALFPGRDLEADPLPEAPYFVFNIDYKIGQDKEANMTAIPDFVFRLEDILERVVKRGVFTADELGKSEGKVEEGGSDIPSTTGSRLLFSAGHQDHPAYLVMGTSPLLEYLLKSFEFYANQPESLLRYSEADLRWSFELDQPGNDEDQAELLDARVVCWKHLTKPSYPTPPFDPSEFPFYTLKSHDHIHCKVLQAAAHLTRVYSEQCEAEGYGLSPSPCTLADIPHFSLVINRTHGFWPTPGFINNLGESYLWGNKGSNKLLTDSLAPIRRQLGKCGLLSGLSDIGWVDVVVTYGVLRNFETPQELLGNIHLVLTNMKARDKGALKKGVHVWKEKASWKVAWAVYRWIRNRDRMAANPALNKMVIEIDGEHKGAPRASTCSGEFFMHPKLFGVWDPDRKTFVEVDEVDQLCLALDNIFLGTTKEGNPTDIVVVGKRDYRNGMPKDYRGSNKERRRMDED
ncbi:hypothetical protein P7C70_g5341, partial [Phenoliferia sp. Uapishka_3]